MGYILKEIPLSERPRERLAKQGVRALSNYELLAIIFRTGVRDVSALDLAKDLLQQYPLLNELTEVTIHELENIKGIGPAKAVTLLAAIELGKRINEPSNTHFVIHSPNESYQYLQQHMQHLTQENLVCLFLNTKSEVIAEKIISIGTLNQTLFHPRDVLKWALKHSAAGIILAHNHPSGDPTPSRNDIEVTKRLVESARLVDVNIIDHIIIGKNRYYSFMENKNQANLRI